MCKDIGYYKDCLRKVYECYPCLHFGDCKKGLDYSEEFSHFFYKARIGEEYGTSGRMKVLFVGREGTSGGGDLSENDIAETPTITTTRNSHYKGTVFTAALLLGLNPKSNQIDYLREAFPEVHRYFCLTNYFKCAFKKKPVEKVEKGTPNRGNGNRGVKHSRAMVRNCMEIFFNEVEILQPDVIVLQGKYYSEYTNVFWDSLTSRFECQTQEYKPFESEKVWISLTEHKYSNGQPLYVIWSYHPSAQRFDATIYALKEIIDEVRRRYKQIRTLSG